MMNANDGSIVGDSDKFTMALTYDTLENTSARSLLSTQRICLELTVDVVSNATYQCFHLFDAVFCVVALIAQPVVHYKFLLPSALHFNLKMLLVMHFFASMVYASTVLSSIAYRTMLWLWHRDPCDIFPNRTFYIFVNVIGRYSLMSMLNLQLLVSIERAVATIYVNTYESWKKTSGIVYVFPACVIPGMIVLYVYKGVSFNEPYISVLSIQSATTGRLVVISLIAIFVSLISMAMQRILAMVNRRRSFRLTTAPLTIRYQLSENISGSNLTSSLLLFQVLATVVQSSLTLLLPQLPLRFADSEWANEIIVREIVFIVPLAMAILPFLILYLLKKRQRTRAATIHRSVCQSKVGDATGLYVSMLKRQWE